MNSISRNLQNVCKYKMSNVKLNLIAACDSKMGIGLKNELPWRLRNEMAYFNRMTTGVSKDAGAPSGESKRNVVVMGRKTWDSIPVKFRPLKGRINIILSRSKPENEEIRDDVIWTDNWDDTIQKLDQLEKDEKIGKIWITGGSFVYKLALDSPYCHRIYLTKIQNDYGCDVIFPEFDLDAYQLVNFSWFITFLNINRDPEVPGEEQQEANIKYNFLVYEKTV